MPVSTPGQEPTTSNPPQRFDLDFRGGAPDELVAVIEKATGKPLNVIIPEEYRSRREQSPRVSIPAMKVTNVTVPDLFDAIRMANVSQASGFMPGMQPQYGYGFETRGQGEDAVWYFYNRPAPAGPLDVCRFYQLAGYLESFTIQDITTAIQTGWDLLGVNPKPRLKFHPETKLLIAVGQPDELRTIEDVLAQLGKASPPNEVHRLMPKPMTERRPPPGSAAPEPTPKKDGESDK
jgi:hypothetical protein